MGFGTERDQLAQAKKAQGETNQRLDAILAEQKRTNVHLAELLGALRAAQAPRSSATA